MATYQVSLLIVFGIIGYMIVVDKNVSDYLILLYKMLKLKFERIFWMIKLHPKNPITNLIKKWEYDRIAKTLKREMESERVRFNNNSQTIE